MTVCDQCPIKTTLSVIGGKWKLPIIYFLLQQSPMRFGELRKSISKISQKVLTDQLRELEMDGIVLRTVYPEVPLKVEYSLSVLGRDLAPVFKAMSDFGLKLQMIHQRENSDSAVPISPAVSASAPCETARKVGLSLKNNIGIAEAETG